MMYAFLKRVKGHIQMIIKIEETEEETEEDSRLSNEGCIMFVSGDIKKRREKCIHELIMLFTDFN